MAGNIYDGIDAEPGGAMNPKGNIIRDAWVFGIIPETETCKGWLMQGVADLYDQVSDAWEPYGGIPSNLPPELREKHQRIYAAAIKQARKQGWDPEAEIKNEEKKALNDELQETQPGVRIT